LLFFGFLTVFSRFLLGGLLYRYYLYLILFLLIYFDLNPALFPWQAKPKVEKLLLIFTNFPLTFWEIALCEVYIYFLFFGMKNNFINNNGANLLNISKNKKTKVESQIEMLKQQEQEIKNKLWFWETKHKKAEQLMNYLEEVNRFSTKFLAEAVAKGKKEKKWLEHLIKNKVKFALKFEPAKQVFNKLVFQKIENQVNYLKSQLRTIQEQLTHQERIFARIEIRRQGRELLTCEYKTAWVV
jgi:hypothetical protein